MTFQFHLAASGGLRAQAGPLGPLKGLGGRKVLTGAGEGSLTETHARRGEAGSTGASARHSHSGEAAGHLLVLGVTPSPLCCGI